MKKENSAKVVIDETYLNIMKAKYDKTTANIIVNNEKLKTFPLKSALRLGCPYSSLLVLGILTTPFKDFQQLGRFLRPLFTTFEFLVIQFLMDVFIQRFAVMAVIRAVINAEHDKAAA